MKFDGVYERKRYKLSRSADALRFVLTVFDRARQGRRTSANAGGFMRSLLCSRFFKVCTYAQGRLSPAEGQAAGPRTFEGADGCFYMYGRCSRERNERTGQGQLSPGWSLHCGLLTRGCVPVLASGVRSRTGRDGYPRQVGEDRNAGLSYLFGYKIGKR